MGFGVGMAGARPSLPHPLFCGGGGSSRSFSCLARGIHGESQRAWKSEEGAWKSRMGSGGSWRVLGGLCSGIRADPPSLPRRYAEVVVASENSVHKLLELLPGKILNGDKVEVRLATRQNLSQFEAQARKRECGAGATRAGVPPHAHPKYPPDQLPGPAQRALGMGGYPARSVWGLFFPFLSRISS